MVQSKPGKKKTETQHPLAHVCQHTHPKHFRQDVSESGERLGTGCPTTMTLSRRLAPLSSATGRSNSRPWPLTSANSTTFPPPPPRSLLPVSLKFPETLPVGAATTSAGGSGWFNRIPLVFHLLQHGERCWGLYFCACTFPLLPPQSYQECVAHAALGRYFACAA